MDLYDLLPSWQGLRDNLWAGLVMAVPAYASWLFARVKGVSVWLQWIAFSVAEVFLGLSGQAAVSRFGVLAVPPSLVVILAPLVLLIWKERTQKKVADQALSAPSGNISAAVVSDDMDWHERRRSAVLAVAATYIRSSWLTLRADTDTLKEMEAPIKILWAHYLKDQERKSGGPIAEAVGVLRTMAEKGYNANISSERLNSAVRTIARLCAIETLIPAQVSGARVLEIRARVDPLSDSWSYQQHPNEERLTSAIIRRKFIVLEVRNVGDRALSEVIAKCRFVGDQQDFEGSWSEDAGAIFTGPHGLRVAALGVQNPRLLIVGQCVGQDRLVLRLPRHLPIFSVRFDCLDLGGIRYRGQIQHEDLTVGSEAELTVDFYADGVHQSVRYRIDFVEGEPVIQEVPTA